MTLTTLPTVTNDEMTADAAGTEPALVVSLLPIAIPLAMIASGPVGSAVYTTPPVWIELVANMNFALFVATFVALGIYVFGRRASRFDVAKLVEDAVISAGGIVLITAAGGAFGAMLKVAGVGPAIEALFAGNSQMAGYSMLWLAFGIAALLKTAQGSTTVALITASGMVAAMQEGLSPAFHPVYMCTAIGSGAMITSWMNDSGFWIFCRMGGLTESEGLRSWSPIMIVMGLAGMATTLLLATIWPGI